MFGSRDDGQDWWSLFRTPGRSSAATSPSAPRIKLVSTSLALRAHSFPGYLVSLLDTQRGGRPRYARPPYSQSIASAIAWSTHMTLFSGKITLTYTLLSQCRLSSKITRDASLITSGTILHSQKTLINLARFSNIPSRCSVIVSLEYSGKSALCPKIIFFGHFHSLPLFLP